MRNAVNNPNLEENLKASGGDISTTAISAGIQDTQSLTNYIKH